MGAFELYMIGILVFAVVGSIIVTKLDKQVEKK